MLVRLTLANKGNLLTYLLTYLLSPNSPKETPSNFGLMDG